MKRRVEQTGCAVPPPARARPLQAAAGGEGSGTAVGVPLVAAYLCADHRRCWPGARSPRPRRLEAGLKPNLKTGADTAAASAVGKLLAERAKAAGVAQVVFDRGAYLYHGRVKALADAAREGGLDF